VTSGTGTNCPPRYNRDISGGLVSRATTTQMRKSIRDISPPPHDARRAYFTISSNGGKFLEQTRNVLTQTGKTGMITIRNKWACSATAFLMLVGLLVRPSAATPVRENLLQSANYGSDEDSRVMLIPAIDDSSHWYASGDYPLEGAATVIEAPSSNEVMKKAISKRAGDRIALDRIFSRMRSRHTKENSKRGIDFGLGRGFSGSQAAKHFMGIAAAQYSGGPGKRKRSGLPAVYANEERW